MLSHIKTLGILHIILSSLGVLLAVGVFVVFGSLAVTTGLGKSDPGSNVSASSLGGIAFFVSLIILCISLPGLIGGIGLLKQASWARVLMIIISAIDLVNVPLGTALGIYGLWVLTKPETQALLAPRPYGQQSTY